MPDVNGSELPASAGPKNKHAHMVNSERVFGRVVGVPFHTFMKEADVVSVVGELERLACEP